MTVGIARLVGRYLITGTLLTAGATGQAPDDSHRHRVPAAAICGETTGPECLAERFRRLEKLVKTSPAEAISNALSEADLQHLRFGFPDVALYLEEWGTWSGIVTHWAEDHRGGVSESYVLRTDHALLRLHFTGDKPVEWTGATMISVSGLRVGSEVAAVGASALPDASPVKRCQPIGEQRAAVLMASFPGQARPDVQVADMRDVFLGSAPSVDSYWRSASYGRAWLTGDVFGWVDLDRRYDCTEPFGILSAAIAAFDSKVDLSAYNRIFVYFPGPCESFLGASQVTCAAGSSLALIPISPGFNTSSAVQTAVHEGGHGFGLNEAVGREYDSEAMGSPEQRGLRYVYYDPFTPMGNFTEFLGHYNARQKLQIGWLDSLDVAAIQEPGSYTVAPIGRESAVPRALRVLRPGTQSWLWIEYRQPTDAYESGLPPSVFSGALLHAEDSGNRDSVAARGSTDLLDFTPVSDMDTRSNFLDAALPAGSRWEDPWTPLSIAVEGDGGDGLKLQIGHDSCVESLKPAVVVAGPGEEEKDVFVAAPSDCNWTVRTSQPWVAVLSHTEGVGDGLVRIRVAATGARESREATLAIGRVGAAIRQEGLNADTGRQ